MCGKNSLIEVIGKKNLKGTFNEIIKIFNILKDKDIYYVPISYFLLKLDNEDKIYSVIHTLLDYGIIEKFEFERCPICCTEHIANTLKDKTICSRCNDIFHSDFIIEKFKLVDGMLQDE